MTTIETLFGIETIPSKPKSIRLKVITPIYQNLTINENLPHYLTKSTAINSSQVIYDMFSFLVRETKEHFIALHLDTKNRIICIDQVSVGSLSAAIVHPREVFKSCLLSSCAALVVLHNHPSGDPTASREDIELTTRLKSAADLLGIRLLDHVVIGDGHYISFADRGLL